MHAIHLFRMDSEAMNGFFNHIVFNLYIHGF